MDEKKMDKNDLEDKAICNHFPIKFVYTSRFNQNSNG